MCTLLFVTTYLQKNIIQKRNTTKTQDFGWFFKKKTSVLCTSLRNSWTKLIFLLEGIFLQAILYSRIAFYFSKKIEKLHQHVLKHVFKKNRILFVYKKWPSQMDVFWDFKNDEIPLPNFVFTILHKYINCSGLFIFLSECIYFQSAYIY